MDTFPVAVEGSDVDGCNALGSEDNVEDTIVIGRSERDSLAAESLWDFEIAAKDADMPALLDTAYDVAGTGRADPRSMRAAVDLALQLATIEKRARKTSR